MMNKPDLLQRIGAESGFFQVRFITPFFWHNAVKQNQKFHKQKGG